MSTPTETIPTEDCSTAPVVLGNEPRSYRETVAAVLRATRPGLVVREVEPAELDGAVAACPPRFVVCSEATPAVRAHAPAWLLLYPEGTRMAVSSRDGQESVTGSLDLAGLLALVDRAAPPATSATSASAR
jgi:hypothetical protein